MGVGVEPGDRVAESNLVIVADQARHDRQYPALPAAETTGRGRGDLGFEVDADGVISAHLRPVEQPAAYGADDQFDRRLGRELPARRGTQGGGTIIRAHACHPRSTGWPAPRRRDGRPRGGP